MKWIKKDITTLKRLWKNGKKLREIAETMGRSQNSVTSKVALLQRSGELGYRHKDAQRRAAKKVITTRLLTKTKALAYKTGKKKKYLFNHPIKDVAGVKDFDTTATKLSDKKEWKDLMNVVFGSTEHKIQRQCDEIKSFLLQKNKAYGDSALAPIRIFSTSDASEQLKVRIDDKLNRLMQGDASIEADEDVVKDLIGYLILLLIQMKENK